MTISSTTRKAGPFVGNGVTTEFPFDFKLFATSDLRVVRADALGAETDLVHVTDCTVTLNADQDENPGGSVVLNSPLADGFRLVLLSAVPELQPVDLTNQGGFYPELVNGGLDRATVQVQQLREQMSRSITVPVTSEPGDLSLPSPAPGQLIGWTGDGLTNFDPSELVSVVAYGDAKLDVFEGDGSTATFTLSASPGALNNLRISIAGVVQTPGEDFTWSGGTTLTFAAAPPAGTAVVVQYQEALQDVGGATEAGAEAGLAAALEVIGAKADKELETNASITQFGAGASPVTVAQDFSHIVRASQYVQPGDGSDMGLSANRAIAAIRTRGYGELFFDNGVHEFSTPINNGNSGESGSNPLSHISMIAPGSASCELRWTGANGVNCINVEGGTWGGGSDTRLQMRGFTLRGMDARPATNRLGIKAERTNFLKMEDVYLKEFYQALHATDVVGAKLEDVNISFNSQGIIGDGGLVPSSGSAPNEWTISRCHFGNNREFWAKLTGVTNLVVLNGSNEGNGLSVGGLGNNATAVGLWLVNPCFNGATAMKMIGMHHEYSVGRADVLIQHDQNPAIYSFDGIDLFRVDANISVASHIEIETTGATPYVVNLSNVGVGFNIYGSPVYVPTANDIIKRTGTPNARDEVNAFGVNIQSGMTRPAFTNEVFKTFSAGVSPATGSFGGAVTQDIGLRINGKSATIEGTITVANNGTGAGQIVVSATGVVAKRNIFCGLGRNNATGATLQVLALAGTQNLQITTIAGSYPLSSGEQIAFHAEYEIA